MCQYWKHSRTMIQIRYIMYDKRNYTIMVSNLTFRYLKLPSIIYMVTAEQYEDSCSNERTEMDIIYKKQ